MASQPTTPLIYTPQKEGLTMKCISRIMGLEEVFKSLNYFKCVLGFVRQISWVYHLAIGKQFLDFHKRQ